MSDAQRLDLQTDYWNRIGPTKPFAHPINIDQLSRWVSPQSRILDYGRALGFLHAHGFSNLIGVDPMPAMISAARRNFPAIPFEVLDDYQKVQLDDASVDAVLLFAVLTSVPTNDGQRAIISEITRVLRPNGILYISDMFLQTDSRNLERYIDGEKKYGMYGVFDLSDGVVVRHHERSWIEKLTADYETLNLEEITVPTMNLHPAAVFQWFGRKSRIQ
jgi:SAM-dependent methyltransferase